jgi:hypothetical protein
MILLKRTMQPAPQPLVPLTSGKVGAPPPIPTTNPIFAPTIMPIGDRPLTPPIPSGGIGSGTSISGPTLPVPGLSGIGWIRDSKPLAGTPVVADPPAGAGAPIGPESGAGGVPTGAPMTAPTGLAEPNSPSTADNPGRFTLSPAERHAGMFRRLPDVGGFAPWQGVKFKLGSGRAGGVPELPRAINAGVPIADPIDIAESGRGSSMSAMKGLRATIAAGRRAQKKVWNITPGIGGLDVAMGKRMVPDTPSGLREAIRDKRGPKLHGSFIGHSTAPNSEVIKAAVARATARVGGPLTEQPVSSPVSTPSPGPLTDTGLPLSAPTAAAPTPKPAGAPVMLIALAVVALIALR